MTQTDASDPNPNPPLRYLQPVPRSAVLVLVTRQSDVSDAVFRRTRAAERLPAALRV